MQISNIFGRQGYWRISAWQRSRMAVLASWGAYVCDSGLTYVDFEPKVGHL